MGPIQGSLNQLLSLSSIALRISPYGESQLEKQKEKKQITASQKRIAAYERILEEADFQEDVVEDLTTELAAESKELARLDPSEENIRGYATYAEGAKEIRKDVENERREAEYNLLREQNRLRMGGVY